jgi:hypothetical protein
MSVAQCNMCPDDKTRFKVPWDVIGATLMRAHLDETHPGWKPTDPTDFKKRIDIRSQDAEDSDTTS